MASTNKTANLHLNQWVATDPVLREDFNADNAAVDTAFGNILFRKIREIRLAQNAMAFEIDLSDIDLDDYAELQLRITLDTAEDNNADEDTCIYFNSTAEDDDTVLRVLPRQEDYWDDETLFIHGGMPNSTTCPPGFWELRMQVAPSNASGKRLLAGSYLNAYTASIYVGSYTVECNLYAGHFYLGCSALDKIIVQKQYNTANSKPFKAGSVITICGVKR